MTSLASAKFSRVSKRSFPSSTDDNWQPFKQISSEARAPKRARVEVATAPAGKLDDYLGISSALPDPVVPSDELTAIDSTFIAHAAPCKSKAEAYSFREHIRQAHSSDPATHEMLAWRCVELKVGKSGQSPLDFAVTAGSDEDGEKWAGSHMLKVLDATSSVDVAVVCSRWFGRQMLGYVGTHIRNVSTEAVTRLQTALEVDTLREALIAKDARIVELAGPGSPAKPEHYADLDVVKAKRLLLARDKRIALLETLAAKKAQESGGFVRDGEGDGEVS